MMTTADALAKMSQIVPANYWLRDLLRDDDDACVIWDGLVYDTDTGEKVGNVTMVEGEYPVLFWL